jgi:hydroxymethylpyrimidine pyrophosphatase-like HAD family hydrolase
LYVPDGYRFLPHPDINNSLDYQTAYRRLEERLVRTGRAYFQPGKEYSLSIFAANPADTPALHTWAIEALGPLKTTVELSYAASCLNVLPRGLDKASGLAFLTQQTGYRPAEMLGVGDSDSDLPFLAKTGYSAAPANANSAVKQAVQYVSPYQTTAGVRDILARFGIGEA